MDSISVLTYFLKLIWAYGSYYLLYFYNIFRDYPTGVRISALLTSIWLILSIIIIIEIGRRIAKKRRNETTKKNVFEQYKKPIERILWDSDISDDLSKSEILSIMGIEKNEIANKKLLNTTLEKQVFCRMIYDIIIHDQMREGRNNNLNQILDIFAIQKFLEDNVNYGNAWNKVSAINMLRTFKLYISPWVINKLLENKRKRIRRLAMYSSVRGGSENDLEVFESDFYEKNNCIFDEITIGYELQRRKKNGMRLPNLALWTTRFESPEIKCMLVRMMRRFEQKEFCSQLRPMFDATHHKKLVEEICRTWGYLQYKESEDIMANAYSLQSDDTKVAIMHAIARLRSGKMSKAFVYSYENSRNPHVRFEALRCLYNYGREGRMELKELEKRANEKDKRFFAFFHNPITLQKIPLDELQIYHQTIETSFYV
ncbi:MAG: hypothetical protein K5856_02825 [Bacteroidaceae bacterium]|nr:hypothetical protein [Bacteroidaceae bacterium]